jgi:uncharacterized membrane protein
VVVAALSEVLKSSEPFWKGGLPLSALGAAWYLVLTADGVVLMRGDTPGDQ